jgi:hypothetical protein
VRGKRPLRVVTRKLVMVKEHTPRGTSKAIGKDMRKSEKVLWVNILKNMTPIAKGDFKILYYTAT